MPDLRDGESVQVQGSAARPYVLKNSSGVYSCSCPAWRNQSRGIEQRTCKHLRALRGDAAEQARLGAVLPAPRARADAPEPPPLLLAQAWDGATDPAGWLLSEKLDGVRAYWNGQSFVSRSGHRYHAPAWFTAGLPTLPLDGELWIGRRQFQRTVSIVRRHDGSDLWNDVRFVIFDAPAQAGGFEARLACAGRCLADGQPPYAHVLEHRRCRGLAHLTQELDRVLARGGEGLMLRAPGSAYAVGRSATLLKVKRFHDAEARVIGHLSGRGRHRGRLGALQVELANGVRFALGSGLSDAQRTQPPVLGSIVTIRYQEWTDGGVPRFPVFVRVRDDDPLSHTTLDPGGTTMVPAIPARRRFEFRAGRSDKFWEIAVAGADVGVYYGRRGSAGQSLHKTFPDAAAAGRHADQLIRAKLSKGYVEVA